MPWKESSVVDQRVRFVMDYEAGEFSLARLCRIYGISRPCGYKWLRRYVDNGMAGLADRSRAPHHVRHAVAPDVEEAVVAIRRAHPTWGPKKLRHLLQREHPQVRWPAASTIGAILKQHGLTVPRKRRRRTPPQDRPLAHCDGPNRVWCADFKGWFRTGDGQRCDPLTITDAYSRYLLRCQAGRRPTLAWTQGWFEAAFREQGVPDAIRTDNGTPFASRGVGGFSRLSVWWVRLGIVPDRIDPGHPEQNGRHERMHLTLKIETACPPAKTLRAQQKRFDTFRREYNELRPHEALEMATPDSAYTPSTKAYPERLEPLEYPRGVLRRVVGQRGEFYWKHEKVFLGEAFCRQVVGLDPIDDRYSVVYFGEYPLGVFDRDRLRVQHGPAAVRLAVTLGLASPPEGSSATLQSLLAERPVGENV